MKLKLILILAISLNLQLYAQKIKFKVKIEYITTINWETPQSYTSTLYVNDSISYFIFKDYRKGSFSENKEDRTFKLLIGNDSPNSYLYKNNYFLCSEQIFDKHFLVKDSFPKLEWRILNETKTIEKFLCKKAITNFRGRKYTVWFTENIPISKGPWKLGGLPGLILEVTDESHEVKFEINSITNINEDVDILISDKKIISWEDYKKKTIKKLNAFRTYMESSNSDSDISVKINTVKSLEKISLNGENITD